MVHFFQTEKLVKILPYINIGSLEKIFQKEFSELRLDIDITFVDERVIKDLNHKYREVNKVTDVLSFEPVLEVKDPKADVFICPEYIQSNIGKEDLLEEIVRMMIHGILHVKGLDHKVQFNSETARTEKMYLEQEHLLNVVLSQISTT